MEMKDTNAVSGSVMLKQSLLVRKSPPAKKISAYQQIVQLVCATVVAFASYYFATHFIFQTVVVDGDSMNPTLQNSQRLLLNRVEYYIREPERGDIVVLKAGNLVPADARE